MQTHKSNADKADLFGLKKVEMFLDPTMLAVFHRFIITYLMNFYIAG